MTITFRCEHCNKQIEAPDTAGGKRGKCPYCRQSNYIPSRVSEADLLELAPIDEDEERHREQEIQSLLEQEKQLLVESDQEAAAPDERGAEGRPADLSRFVVNYCMDMAAGKLDRAQSQIEKLQPFGRGAHQIVDDFITDKILEPALDSIPTGVLKGFLRQLQSELG